MNALKDIKLLNLPRYWNDLAVSPLGVQEKLNFCFEQIWKQVCIGYKKNRQWC